jgi:alpha-1,2-mannosyltransferase
MAFQLSPGPDPRFDRVGQVMGHDFSHFWVGGRAVLEGRPTDPFDVRTHEANQRRVFGPDVATFGWHYPPPFLLPAALLAMLPLPFSFAVWMLSTNALLLFALWRLVPDWRVPIVALGSPMLFQNFNYGQNAALSAALAAFAVAPFIRGRRPSAWALGLLSYKPNLGLPLPFVLGASGFWKTMLGTAMVIAAQVLITGWILGFETWAVFFQSIEQSQEILLGTMDAGVARYASAFGAARVLGLPVSFAYGLQIISTVLSISLCAAMWFGTGDRRLKAALLIAALPLCTPYLLQYELLILLPAAALLYSYGREYGFGAWDVPVLALLWLLPVISLDSAKLLHVPTAFPAMACFFGLILCKIWSERQTGPAMDLLPAP